LFIGRAWDEGEFLNTMFSCDMCLGVWIYFLLAIYFDMNLIGEVPNMGIDVISWFITGAMTSFLAHIFTIGWKIKFGIVEL